MTDSASTGKDAATCLGIENSNRQVAPVQEEDEEEESTGVGRQGMTGGGSRVVVCSMQTFTGQLV